MTREEYLDILQNNLHGIPPQEAENIMEYYREYFDDAGVENADKVMEELGAPEELAKKAAADFTADNTMGNTADPCPDESTKEGVNGQSSRKKHIAAVVLAITSPIWACILLAIICVLFAVVITLAALVASFGFAAAALVCGGIFTTGTALVTVFLHIPTGVMLIGAGLICIGIGLLSGLAAYGSVILIKWLAKWIVRMFTYKSLRK